MLLRGRSTLNWMKSNFWAGRDTCVIALKKSFKRRIAPPEAVWRLWRCWRSARARDSFTFTPRRHARHAAALGRRRTLHATGGDAPINASKSPRKPYCAPKNVLAYLLTPTPACAYCMVSKSKRQIFFLGDLLENRVDTTYIHKIWSKIVTFVLWKWKKKNESLLRPNPSYT